MKKLIWSGGYVSTWYTVDSSVHIVTMLQAGQQGNWGLIASRSKRIYSSPVSSLAGGSYSGWWGPGNEADHWPLSSAKVKNKWRYYLCTPYAIMQCTGTKLLLPLRPSTLPFLSTTHKTGMATEYLSSYKHLFTLTHGHPTPIIMNMHHSHTHTHTHTYL